MSEQTPSPRPEPPSRELASFTLPLLTLLGVALFIAAILGIWSWGQNKRVEQDRALPPAGPIDNSAAVEAAFAAGRRPVPQLLGGLVNGLAGGMAATPRRPGEAFDPTGGGPTP